MALVVLRWLLATSQRASSAVARRRPAASAGAPRRGFAWPRWLWSTNCSYCEALRGRGRGRGRRQGRRRGGRQRARSRAASAAPRRCCGRSAQSPPPGRARHGLPFFGHLEGGVGAHLAHMRLAGALADGRLSAQHPAALPAVRRVASCRAPWDAQRAVVEAITAACLFRIARRTSGRRAAA